MEIVLPDGSKKALEEGATVADTAAAIGAGLARAALAGIVNGTPVDLTAPPRAPRPSICCATPRPTSWPPPSPTCTPA